jgi:diphosphomevalonate decarboxylase
VTLPANGEWAEPVADGAHFPLAMAVVLTATGPKAVSSTEGMRSTARTSPYYPAWVQAAPEIHATLKSALLARDLEGVGHAMERSALLMHASMFAGDPPLVYFNAATLAVVERVRALRAEGIAAFFTMDAGPHVKVLVAPEDLSRVAAALSKVHGVDRVLETRIGPGARVVETDP